MNITLYSEWIKYHEITGVRLACATGTVVNCFGSFLKTFLKTFAFIKLCNLSKENNGKYNGKYKGKYNGKYNGKYKGKYNGKHNGKYNGKTNQKPIYLIPFFGIYFLSGSTFVIWKVFFRGIFSKFKS